MKRLPQSLRLHARWMLLPCVLACALCVASAGCADPIPPADFAQRDFNKFKREVYPVLLRDCGFPACHGHPARFFRVWGPGRVRLPTQTTDANGMAISTLPEPFDVPTIAEQQGTFAFALSMIEERDVPSSLLLRKPLAVEAGGAGHLGTDSYGRDVYRTTQDSGYVTIARWVLSESTAPAMAAP